MKISRSTRNMLIVAGASAVIAFSFSQSVFLAIVWAIAGAASHSVLVASARKRNKRQRRVKRDLVLSLFDGAIGANFYVRPRIDRQEDGTILIKTGQLGMAQENNEALKGFARLYVAGPAVIEDDVAGEGWRNIERGLEQTLTGYFDQVVGPPGFAPFAARALREASGESYAFIRIRGNVSNADEEALRVKIDSAMSSIDELYQSGKVQIVEEGL